MRFQRLAGMSLTGALLFNYPVISVFSRLEASGTFPPLYLFLFGVWGALIGLTAFLMERHGRVTAPPEDGS